MKEDIMSGSYIDPLELDEFQINNLNQFSKGVQKLSEDLLAVHRKKKRNQYVTTEPDHYVDLNRMGNPMLHTVPVIDAGAWTEDAAVSWPDLEAKAFLAELEKFRQRPESNTGYTNEALNAKMKAIYGDERINSILNKGKPVEESLEYRLRKRLNTLQENRRAKRRLALAEEKEELEEGNKLKAAILATLLVLGGMASAKAKDKTGAKPLDDKKIEQVLENSKNKEVDADTFNLLATFDCGKDWKYAAPEVRDYMKDTYGITQEGWHRLPSGSWATHS